MPLLRPMVTELLVIVRELVSPDSLWIISWGMVSLVQLLVIVIINCTEPSNIARMIEESVDFDPVALRAKRTVSARMRPYCRSCFALVISCSFFLNCVRFALSPCLTEACCPN